MNVSSQFPESNSFTSSHCTFYISNQANTLNRIHICTHTHTHTVLTTIIYTNTKNKNTGQDMLSNLAAV